MNWSGRLAISLCLLVTTAACNNFVRSNRREPPIPARATYGSPNPPTPKSTDAKASPDTGDTGAFIVLLVDQNGLNPSGIPVSVEGPLSSSFTSGKDGAVRIQGPAGYYTLSISAGCTEDLQVLAPATARVGIAAGQTASARLAVTWRHRVGPGGRVTFTPDEGRVWTTEGSIRVSFDLYDRCTEGSAPGAFFETFVYRPTNLRVFRRPVLQADELSRGHVDVACAGKGQARLEVSDSKNPSDQIELFRLQGGPIPYCS